MNAVVLTEGWLDGGIDGARKRGDAGAVGLEAVADEIVGVDLVGHQCAEPAGTGEAGPVYERALPRHPDERRA